MSLLTSPITYDKEFSSALSAMRSAIRAGGGLPIAVNGLSGGAPTAFLSESITALRGDGAPPSLIIERDADMAEHRAAELVSLGIKAAAFKPRALVFNKISASHDSERERLSVLSSLLRGECEAVVTTLSAVLFKTLPRETLASRMISFSLGDTLSPRRLAERLSDMGFQRVFSVDGAGQFAVRGGIVDFWADVEKAPIRVEFFGDEIDRITEFDPISQRSASSLSSAGILPAREVVPGEGQRARLIEFIRREISRGNDALSGDLLLLESDSQLLDIDKYLGVKFRWLDAE